jgi:GNAT superfamily N-acetyltransferase
MTTFRFLQASDLGRLRTDWEELFLLQYQQGLSLRAPTDGFDLWLASIEPLLGRYAVVAGAEKDGEIVAFVAGRFRNAVPYLGGQSAGYVSEVFTRDAFRNHGLGAQLLDMVVDWFRLQGISRVELHVAAGNPNGLRFYQRHGWKTELLQLVLDT